MIYRQSVFEPWPIESESVQAVITSPPYYALRKYSIPDIIIGGDKDCKHEFETVEYLHPTRGNRGQANDPKFAIRKDSQPTNNKADICIHCNAWKGQYGLEPTAAAFVEHTRLWAKEAWRVLRNDGIFFLNLADSYSTISGGMNQMANKGTENTPQYGLIPYKYEGVKQNKEKGNGVPSKCQLLIPHRVAIALVDDGWTLRNTICWFKSNAMPESVTDRFSKKYEYIYMFTKQEKYYFDLGSVKEPLKESTVQRIKYLHGQSGEKHSELRKVSGKPQGDYSHLKSKNPGDVWVIPTAPSTEKHFAMWPERLVERMVKCSTKAGDTVLDCFAGSCTTGIVAESLHRKFIGIELGYEDIHKRRMSKIQKKLLL